MTLKACLKGKLHLTEGKLKLIENRIRQVIHDRQSKGKNDFLKDQVFPLWVKTTFNVNNFAKNCKYERHTIQA